MRRILLLTAFVAVLTSSAALAKASFPEVIALPNGWQPEGIAIGKGTTFYVGSIPTGAVYRGDLRTGKGSTLVAGAAGRSAIGRGSSRRPVTRRRMVAVRACWPTTATRWSAG